METTREEILFMLESAVHDIFATCHKKEGIISGDIDPLSAYALDESMNPLAECIYQVLNTQKAKN